MPTRKFPNHQRLRSPREVRSAGREFLFVRDVQARGEQRTGCHLTQPFQLRDRQIDDGSCGALGGVHGCDGAVRRPQINPNEVGGRGHKTSIWILPGRAKRDLSDAHSSPFMRTLSSSFHRPCPSRSRHRISSVPNSVTTACRFTGTSLPSFPSDAGKVLSMGANSSNSSLSVALSIISPTLSARRSDEAKNLKRVGSLTTSPNSWGGTSAW